jgi:hypothetical protein
MDKTQVIVANVVGSIVVLVIAVGALLFLRSFMRRLQSGQGPMGSVLHETREVAKERLQVERELLAAQKETNELLKQMIAKQKP